MKILAVHSALNKNPNSQSGVDMWRIYRPLRELAKHVDWQIDHQPTFIPGFEKYKDLKEFTQEELEKAFKKICEYDIVFSSYHADPAAFSLLQVASTRGTKFIMDCDDDMFAINPDNPYWMKMNDEQTYQMQRMIAHNLWMSTTTETLKKSFVPWRKETGKDDDSVFVMPNFIPDDYKHPEFDNSPYTIIGYFGGSSHYDDLHETGVLRAIEKLMHENKKVKFKIVGMIAEHYTPRARTIKEEGARGSGWIKKVFPKLKLDISIGPLNDNLFNAGKSNIKWQESTRMGSAFVASRVGPYKTLSSKVAVTVPNTEEAWYNALKKLVNNKQKRYDMVKQAQKELDEKWRLEKNWQKYKEMFECVLSTPQSPPKKTILVPSTPKILLP